MKNVLATGILLGAVAVAGAFAPATRADTPSWMREAASAPLPAHDEKTDAVMLYSEEVISVQPNGKIKNLRRHVFKILRPDGKGYGLVLARFDPETKITIMRGWCIPAQGKDYEVKEKDAIETAQTDVENGALATDFRMKYLRIPASDPGNIVGYEIEQEERPYVFEAK